MHLPSKQEIESKAEAMLQVAFDNMPSLSVKEKKLLVNLGARLYNQGVIDMSSEVLNQMPASVTAQDRKDE